MANKHDNDAFKTQEEAMALLKESYQEGIIKYDQMKVEKASKGKAEGSNSEKEEIKTKKGGMFGGGGYMGGKRASNTKDEKETGKEAGKSNRTQAAASIDISRNLEDMMRLNAGITGANQSLIEVILRSFRTIVEDMLRLGELQEHTDFLAMEIRREVTGNYKLVEFKLCLLASFPAIIPGMWNRKYEAAWSWFCDSIEAQINDSSVPAKVHEAPLKAYVKSLTPDDYQKIGTKVWREGVFKQCPEAEMRLKQSMQRFVFISKSALEFAATMFDEPSRMKQQLTQLGLRHILFQVDASWFAIFAEQMAIDAYNRSQDTATQEAVRWCISIMGSLMSRTLTTASTPILVAAVKDDVKALKKAMAAAPRGSRGSAMLFA